MPRSGLVRSLAVVVGAFLIASCSEAGIFAAIAPSETIAAPASAQFAAQVHIGDVVDATHLKLKAVWWRNNHQKIATVSKTIDQSGGTISIPETGLTISFPAGAVATPIKITVTSDDKYVAYKMEPSGTRFLKDVTVTQLLSATAVSGAPLRSQLYAAYIADDKLNLSGVVKALEIEPSTTIFRTTSPLLPEAQVWVIRHFSRYILASG
jgi:hypothetical protein